MVLSFESKEPEKSEIQQYFAGKTIFITGGTGFLGKLLLEKLIRTCTDIERVYMLIREKKGKNIEKRFEEMLESVFFDVIKQKQPKFTNKITLVNGDCALSDLGIEEEVQKKLIDEVNCVFHCAATVRFNEKIWIAANTNVRGTRDILNLSKKIKHMEAFLYVSTAYSHCTSKDIDEKFYEPPLTGENFINLVNILDNDILDKITPTLIGDWPNTYAFSKAVAEDIVRTTGKGLPIAIVRPSIVVATFEEPVTGWIDNIYGATGVLVGGSLGLIRTMNCKQENLADMVPADFVINCTIAAAWEIGTTGNSNYSNKVLPEAEKTDERNVPIYNYVSSTQRPLTWRETAHLAEKHAMPIKSPLVVWYPFSVAASNRVLYLILLFFLHTIPAYIVDFLAYCIGKPRLLVKGYQKINKFLDVLAYFATQQWNFCNDNTQALWKKLNSVDKKLFKFDMEALAWETYFQRYAMGARIYLLKDPLDTIPQGELKYRKLVVAHYTLVALLLLGLYKLMMFSWRCLF